MHARGCSSPASTRIVYAAEQQPRIRARGPWMGWRVGVHGSRERSGGRPRCRTPAAPGRARYPRGSGGYRIPSLPAPTDPTDPTGGASTRLVHADLRAPASTTSVHADPPPLPLPRVLEARARRPPRLQRPRRVGPSRGDPDNNSPADLHRTHLPIRHAIHHARHRAAISVAHRRPSTRVQRFYPCWEPFCGRDLTTRGLFSMRACRKI